MIIHLHTYSTFIASTLVILFFRNYENSKRIIFQRTKISEGK
jgi:hypothetical protein